MDSSRPRASASVIAAGVVAIIGGALAAITFLASLLFVTRVSIPSSSAPIPPALRPFIYGIWVFLLFCAVLVLVAGIGVIRLRNWARITLLIFAGFSLFFGVVGIGVIIYTIYVMPPEPGVSKALLTTILAFIYGIPIIVALWWLILFTRRSVTDQFAGVAAPVTQPLSPSASLFNNPRCPLAIRIIGWYLASFILFLPLLPFLPKSIPAVLFARVFHGPTAMLLYFLTFLLISIPGIGLLLLRRWSFPLAIAGQLLTILNLIVTVSSHSFESSMTTAIHEMGLPSDLPPPAGALLHQLRYLNLFGLTIPLAIIVVLILYRRQFFSASDPSSNNSPDR